MTAKLAFEATLPLDLDAAIERVTEALKVEGFGVLTRIDVHDTLKKKIGADFRPYVILGACNPTFAHRALSVRGDVGLLLPCNVTVESAGAGSSLVRIVDPAAMMSFGEFGEVEALQRLGDEARDRLSRVARSLQAG